MRRFLFASQSCDPFYNLALESWFLTASKFFGSELMFIYRNEPCLVIGRNQNAWAECDVALARSKNIPILRRFSGGGAVIHDLGNWNYSFHADRERFNRSAGAELIINALDPSKTQLTLSPRHDIYNSNGAKISGSAFKITRNRAYHHGTLLLQSNLSELLPLLHSPLHILPPDADCAFGGVSSVRAVKVENFIGCTVAQFPALIERAFGCQIQIPNVPEEELEADRLLLKSWDWTFGKSPAFKALVNNGQVVLVTEGFVEGEKFDNLSA